MYRVRAGAGAEESDPGPVQPLATDRPTIRQWRTRMGTGAARNVYRHRAALIACVNAQARNRGLLRLRVRCVEKVKSVVLWLRSLTTWLARHDGAPREWCPDQGYTEVDLGRVSGVGYRFGSCVRAVS
jgi:hypothetical protein